MEANNSHHKTFLLKRKSYISLLETLIAVSLLSILLTIVFGFFRELSVMSAYMEKQQKESFQLRYLESRLAFIFERIVDENDKTRKFYFYSSPPQSEISAYNSLIFTFNNGVRLNPRFSGDVLARLYVDQEHRLRLAVWPLYIPQPHQSVQEEVLLENVADIEYEFYSPPEQITNKNAVESKKIDANAPEKDQWLKEWLQRYKHMPGIVKLKIFVAKNPKDLERFTPGTRIETTELLLSFVLPSRQNPLHYPSQE